MKIVVIYKLTISLECLEFILSLIQYSRLFLLWVEYLMLFG
jgi:hypothetical protein